jgi:L,D-transpeptidase ErfK/SrfK
MGVAETALIMKKLLFSSITQMRYLLLTVFLAWSAAALAEALPGVAMTGGVYTYRIKAGDTLGKIGARYGVEPDVLLRENGLDPARPLKIGRELRLDNRHIVPAGHADGIIINAPQRMLFRLREGKVDKAYPVGMGRRDWPTDRGDFKITSKQEGKTWFVPLSIQKEMELLGEEVRSEVPPGPDNPLGRYWMGLSLPGLGIHGTIAPESIYHFQSHGCIRLHPDDAAEMFATTNKGDTGSIIYQPVLLYRAPDNKIYLEAHRDIYRQGIDANGLIKELAATAHVDSYIDWNKVAQVIVAREGVARDVTRAARQENP